MSPRTPTLGTRLTRPDQPSAYIWVGWDTDPNLFPGPDTRNPLPGPVIRNTTPNPLPGPVTRRTTPPRPPPRPRRVRTRPVPTDLGGGNSGVTEDFPSKNVGSQDTRLRLDQTPTKYRSYLYTTPRLFLPGPSPP